MNSFTRAILEKLLDIEIPERIAVTKAYSFDNWLSI